MCDSDDDTYLFIGSSSVATFRLVYGSKVRVLRFSAATAKGLGQDNKNSQDIWDTLQTKYARVDLSAIVWMFGNVDTKFSYYYKLCEEWTGNDADAPDPFELMEECAVKYMQFIKKVHSKFLIPKGNSAKTVVIGAEPNGTVPKMTFEQCVKYFVARDTLENRKRIDDAIQEHHPDLLRRKFNDTLKGLCVDNDMAYVDVDDTLLTQQAIPEALDISVVKPEYVDISPSSSHINWESVLKLYINKLKQVNVCIDETLDLAHTRTEYLNEKQSRKRKPASVIDERWQKNLKTHIDDRGLQLK